MAQTWQGTLPTAPLIDGNSESFSNNVIRSNMEYGLPKIRKRFTAGYSTHTYKMRMTDTQVATFQTFYDTTCDGGADSFEWTNPRTGSTDEWLFAAPPVAVHDMKQDVYLVSFSLLKVP